MKKRIIKSKIDRNNIRLFVDEFQNELDLYYDYTGIGTRYKHKLRINNFERMCNKLILKQNYKILDIGCGRGVYSIILGCKDYFTIGIDIDESSLRKAQTWSMKRNIKNISFIRADATNLPFKDNSFNLIISSEVF